MGLALDDITLPQLRAAGGLKWSLFPDQIGAFVAEMDFGTAPADHRGAARRGRRRRCFGYLPPASATATGRRRPATGARAATAGTSPPSGSARSPTCITGLEVAIEHFSDARLAGDPCRRPAYMPFLTVPAAAGARGRSRCRWPSATAAAVYDLDALDAAFAAGRRPAGAVQPAQPGRAGCWSATSCAASARSSSATAAGCSPTRSTPRWCTPATGTCPTPRVAEVAAGHTRHRDVGVQGLEPARAQVRPAGARPTTPTPRGGTRSACCAAHGAANLGVVANTAAYTAGGPWLDEVLAYLDGNRTLLADLLAEHLPGVGYTPPEGTYLAWLDCRGARARRRPGRRSSPSRPASR